MHDGNRSFRSMVRSFQVRSFQSIVCAPNLKRLWLLVEGISSLIRRFNSAPDLKRLWLQKVKMTSQKLMGVGKSSLIENISLAPNLKRLWLDNVKMTPQKVKGAGIGSLVKHVSCALNLKRLLSVPWLCEDDSTKRNGCRNKQHH